MFKRNPLAGFGCLTKATEKDLIEKKHELKILNASAKGLYAEGEIQQDLKKFMPDFDITAFLACVRNLKNKGIFKVHPNVSEARDERKAMLEVEIKMLEYRLALLKAPSKDVDEYAVIEALATKERVDTPLFLRVLAEFQKANIFFPVTQRAP